MVDAVLMFGFTQRPQSEIDKLDTSDKERYISYDLRRYLIEFDGDPLYNRIIKAVTESKRIDRVALVGHPELKAHVGDDVIFQEMGASKLDNALRGWEALGRPKSPVAYIPSDTPTVTAKDIDELVDLLSEGDFSYPLISMKDNAVWRRGKSRYFRLHNDGIKYSWIKDWQSSYLKEANGIGINFANIDTRGLDFIVENTKIRSMAGLGASLKAFGSYIGQRMRNDEGRFSPLRALQVGYSFFAAITFAAHVMISKLSNYIPPPDTSWIKRPLGYLIGTTPERIETKQTSNVNLSMDMDTAEDAFVLMYIIAKRNNPAENINRWEDLRDRVTYKGTPLLESINITGRREKEWFYRLYNERGKPKEYDSLI